MTETVAIVLESLKRLEEINDWLNANPKKAVRVFFGEAPRSNLIATYNVPGGTKLWDEARPVGGGTTLRYNFEDKQEAMLFKLTWR